MDGAGQQGPLADGLKVRPIKDHTLDKLAVLESYFPAFCTACSGKAPGWNVVDGFCGPGFNEVERTGELVYGSPLLALRAEPAFNRCLCMDLDADNVATLKARSQPYGERAVVLRGDCNVDLVPAMYEHLERAAPTLCVLDPEGTELHFSTIEAASKFRTGPRKTELLILLPTHTGFIRMLSVDKPPEQWAIDRMNALYGTQGFWERIYNERRDGSTTTDEATTRYVKLFAWNLKEWLGYKTVLDREIRADAFRGALRYFLIFATDSNAGREIMDHVFDRAQRRRDEALFVQDALPGLKLPPLSRRKRLDD